MNHRKSYRKLGRDSAHRKAMLANLSKSLIKAQKIETTVCRAKELKRLADKLITMGKAGSLHMKRKAFSIIRDFSLVVKLFDELAPRYTERSGGYTRVLKLGPRRGDGAKMAIIEFV